MVHMLIKQATKCMHQMKSGTLFDNILVCDDPDHAKKLAEETWGKHKDVLGTL